MADVQEWTFNLLMIGSLVLVLVSRIVYTGAVALVTLALILVAGRVVVDDLTVGLGGWLTLAWVAVLGLAAVLPWGAVIGRERARRRRAPG
jgi:ABC-2 type transport system permease protein